MISNEGWNTFIGIRTLADGHNEREAFLDEADMMDPLFDEDWLHENNLDILFDLFEEEIEGKIGVESTSCSSTLFGTSPVTSYLFGTSPSLVSTLDLLYVDNQQQQQQQQQASEDQAQTTQQQHQHQHQQQLQSQHQNQQQQQKHQHQPPQHQNQPQQIAQQAQKQQLQQHRHQHQLQQQQQQLQLQQQPEQRQQQQQHHHRPHKQQLASVSDPIRIKRGLKKGQSEGMSLLAKPKQFPKSLGVSNRDGIDINYSKESQQHHQQQQQRKKVYLHNCQRHIHQMSGRAIIHEHAYAVRGH